MPLSVLAGLFPDEAHARRAIEALVTTGEVNMLDASGVVIGPLQLGELVRQPTSWCAKTHYRLRLTDAGARRIRG